MPDSYDGTYDTAAQYNPQQSTQGLTKYQLDNSPIILEIYHRLRGEIFDYKEQEWKGKDKGGIEPYVNEEGVNQLISWFAPKIDKNIILSNFTEINVEMLTIKAHQDLCLMLLVHYTDWGIENQTRTWPEVLNYIVSTMMPHIYAAYKRAENGGERDFIKELETRTERIIASPEHLPDADRGKIRKWFHFDMKGRNG